MVDKIFLRKVFNVCFALLFAGPAHSSSDSVSISAPFCTKIHTLTTCEDLKTILGNCSNILLFNSESDVPEKYVLCLSGVRPIMNSSSKADLSKRCQTCILDIFDVVVGENAASTRDIMYNYGIIYGIKALIEKIAKSSVKNINSSSLVSNLKDRLSKMVEVLGSCPQIEEWVSKVGACINNSHKEEIVSTIKSIVDVKFREVEDSVSGALNAYLMGLGEYYHFIAEQIHEEKGAKALFGYSVLSVMKRDQLSDCVAYIVDPRSVNLEKLHSFAVKVNPDVQKEDHMSGIVQLSHTEPMVIFFLKKLDKHIQHFFSYRDMCQNCRLMVGNFVQKRRLGPLVVLSQHSCSGQTGTQSTVDFEWHNNKLTPNGKDSLEWICQIRSSDWSSIKNNITVNFEEPLLYRVEIN